ncbi:MAG: hypothetical protein A3F68_08190 [Acidobacteria bacterium RIFCSPLOWO2_12_FULL_54_10]|nr:MAG: hypothetical protein A3F68_08190 [Acidobacteria bacterium RIFCSPLOWO2_12_FULL_54_10]
MTLRSGRSSFIELAFAGALLVPAKHVPANAGSGERGAGSGTLGIPGQSVKRPQGVETSIKDPDADTALAREPAPRTTSSVLIW